MQDLPAVNAATQMGIPDTWFGSRDVTDIIFKAAPLMLLAVAMRGVVLWLLNGVLLVHVVRSVKAMNSTIKEAPVRQERRVGPQPQG